MNRSHKPVPQASGDVNPWCGRRDEDVIHGIARKYGIALIYIFGSQVRAGMDMLNGILPERADPMADLDIGVVFDRDPFVGSVCTLPVPDSRRVTRKTSCAAQRTSVPSWKGTWMKCWRRRKDAGNGLVHLYHQVSDEELYEVIKTSLNDIRQFEQAILDYISRKRSTSGHD